MHFFFFFNIQMLSRRWILSNQCFHPWISQNNPCARATPWEILIHAPLSRVGLGRHHLKIFQHQLWSVSLIRKAELNQCRRRLWAITEDSRFSPYHSWFLESCAQFIVRRRKLQRRLHSHGNKNSGGSFRLPVISVKVPYCSLQTVNTPETNLLLSFAYKRIQPTCSL